MAPRYESELQDASALAKPLHFDFSGRTAQNRFLKGAMSERAATWDVEDLKARGVPTDELVNVYKVWGEEGYGVILSGNVMIEYDHLEAAGNMIIARDNEFSGPRFEYFKKLAAVGKAHGSLMVAQVGHPGRQVSDDVQSHPISASDHEAVTNAFGQTYAKARAATQEDIDRVIDGFAHAAEYLEKAGWDGIQLHAAHGYLLSQFLSPSFNSRTDIYGGSLENRMRIILEVAAECRKRVSKSFVIGIKFNSVEFQDKGFSADEGKGLVQALEKNEFDFVELSGGTLEKIAFIHERESTRKRENFFLEFAETIVKPLTKTKSYVTGGFRTVGGMVKALEVVDGVGLGRPVCQDPRDPKRMLEGKVSGFRKTAIDDGQVTLQVVAAGCQIKQIGRGEEPIDLSTPENVKAFTEDLGAWMEKQKAANGKIVAYADLNSVAAQPYGSVEA